MADTLVEQGRALVRAGIAATRDRQFGEAGRHFFEALELFEELDDARQQCSELRGAAQVFAMAGHPDLALMGLQRVLELNEQLHDVGRHCGDLLSVANTHTRLARRGLAVAANQAALSLALAHDRFADAASASTNLATQAALDGAFDHALAHLEASLGYLGHAEHPHTDFVTRLMLIQVVDLAGADPTLAIEAAPELFSRLAEQLTPEQRQRIEPALRRCIDRYLAARPNLDANAWKQQTFPQLYPEHAE